ncbi:hypothetical protein ACAG96_06650 [Candidatus Izemoplasma sp. B36]|uniref:hypothetical protein n=1 Tax=Candidatus Izemoplasma sp. B36 TaxID=3242468 RepID=UPI0035586E7F
MKKVLLLLFIVIASFGFVGCNNGGSEIDINLDEYIATPSNLEITNKVLSWDEVENADGYVIYVNGEEGETVGTNSYDFSDLTGDSIIFQVQAEAPRGMQDSGLSASIAYIANFDQEVADIETALSLTDWEVPDGFVEELVRKGMTEETLDGYVDGFETFNLEMNASETMSDQYSALHEFLSNFENIEAIISAFVVTVLPENIQYELSIMEGDLFEYQTELEDASEYYQEFLEERIATLEMSIATLEELLLQIQENPDSIVLSIKTTMEYFMSIEELLTDDFINYLENFIEEENQYEPDFNIDEILLLKEEMVNILKETMPTQEEMMLMFEFYDVVAAISEESMNMQFTVDNYNGKMAAQTLLTIEAVINFLDSLDEAYFTEFFSLIEEDENRDMFIADKFILTIKYYDEFRDKNEALLESIGNVFTDEENEILFNDFINSFNNNDLIDEEYNEIYTSLGNINFEVLLQLETTFNDTFDDVLDVFVERDGELLKKYIILEGFTYWGWDSEYYNSSTGEMYDGVAEFNHYRTLATYEFAEELSYILEAVLNSFNDEDYENFIDLLFTVFPVNLTADELDLENQTASNILDAINTMFDNSKGDQLELLQNLINYIVDEEVFADLYLMEEDLYGYIQTQYPDAEYYYEYSDDPYVAYAMVIQIAEYYVDFMNNANRGLVDDIIDEIVIMLLNEDVMNATMMTETEIDNLEANVADLLDFVKTSFEQIKDFDASDLSRTEIEAIQTFSSELQGRLFTITMNSSDSLKG